jgi:hypothetical protein
MPSSPIVPNKKRQSLDWVSNDGSGRVVAKNAATIGPMTRGGDLYVTGADKKPMRYSKQRANVDKNAKDAKGRPDQLARSMSSYARNYYKVNSK